MFREKDVCYIFTVVQHDKKNYATKFSPFPICQSIFKYKQVVRKFMEILSVQYYVKLFIDGS